MRHIISFLGLTILLLTSCADDDFYQGVIKEGQPVKVRVNLVSSDFRLKQTRALTEDEENSWHNVWYAQFSSEGRLVSGPTQKLYSENSGSFVMELESAINSTICFVANADNPFPTSGSGTDLENFKNSLYQPEDITAGDQLVFLGEYNGNITGGNNSIQDILVYLRRLTAKLDVIINVDQVSSTDFYQNFYMRATGIQLCAVSKKSTFGEGYKAESAADVMSLAPDTLIRNETASTETSSVYYSPTYYLLENRQGDLGRGTDKEKNKFAPLTDADEDLATYLLIHAELDDGQNHGKTTYKVYLGGDAATNFDIIRNHHYTVTITIRGTNIDPEVDIRVDNQALHAIQIQRLNGTPATNRQSGEIRYVDHKQTDWGQTGVNLNSLDYLKVFSGNDNWDFELVDITNGENNPGPTPWGTLEYAEPIGDTWSNSWQVGISGSSEGIPSGARIAITMDQYDNYVRERVLLLTVWNMKDPGVKRRWRIGQNPNVALSVPNTAFLTSDGGNYAIPVRASTAVEWKVKSLTTFKHEKTLKIDSEELSNKEDFVNGHGTIVVSAGAYNANTTSPSRSGSLVVSYRSVGGDESAELSEVTILIRQFNNQERIKGLIPSYYNEAYSTGPLFDSYLAYSTTIEWAMNLVENGMSYTDNEVLVGAWNLIDGKSNTKLIYDKVDGYLYDQHIKESLRGEIKPVVITPAGLCLMQNEGFPNIAEGQIKWYLPSRYHAILEATTMMLKPAGLNSNFYYSLWSSATSENNYTEVRFSAYVGGTTADVSGTFSNKHRTRCIRDRSNVDKTYPYVMSNNGNPVIVTTEMVGGDKKGFTNSTDTVYIISRPLRYAEGFANGLYNSNGPTMPRQATLSPKFQVAKSNAPENSNKPTTLTMNWVTANGWNTTATAPATPATGCAAYREGGFTDWRAPTDIEMRWIILLGAGDPAYTKMPKLTYGGDDFSNIAGFNAVTGGNYWTSREYADGTSYTRAYYVGHTLSNGMVGSASNKTSNLRIRCVRDIVDNTTPSDIPSEL